MKPWRWFVGQVARLRRSIAGVVALRRRPADDDALDEARTGPPEHWLEKVRRGAPGLLEPSFRQQGRPEEEPGSTRVVRPESPVEPPPDRVEEHLASKPTPVPRRRQKPPRLRVFRRKPSPELVETPLARVADDTPNEPRPSSRAVDAPPFEPPSRRLPVAEPEPAEPERSPLPTEVVELEPPAQRRPAQVEQAAARTPTENGRQPEHVVEEIGTERVRERLVPAPAPRSEPAAHRLPEPAASRPTPRREPPVEPRPAGTHPPEPLTSVDVHPWPDLPAPLDHPDTEVEAALRAWEHQRRLDREQTRL